MTHDESRRIRESWSEAVRAYTTETAPAADETAEDEDEEPFVDRQLEQAVNILKALLLWTEGESG